MTISEYQNNFDSIKSSSNVMKKAYLVRDMRDKMIKLRKSSIRKGYNDKT